MANTLQLKNDIKKLKGALASKSLSASIKDKLKNQLSKAENELKAAQSGAKPRKVSTTKSTKDALDSLKALIKKDKYSVYKGAGVDLKKDAQEGALATGRRVSKGLKGNQFGSKKQSKGHVYYEYRANRLDVKQPSKAAKYPKLEQGGYMADGGGVISEIKTNSTWEALKDFTVEIDSTTQYSGKGLLVPKGTQLQWLDDSRSGNVFFRFEIGGKKYDGKIESGNIINVINDGKIGFVKDSKYGIVVYDKEYLKKRLKSSKDDGYMAKGGVFGDKKHRFIFEKDGEAHGINYVLIGIQPNGNEDVISEHTTELGAEKKAKNWQKKASPKYISWEIRMKKFEQGGYMAKGGETINGKEYIKTHIDDVKVGDTILSPDGHERTLSTENIQRDRFMGTTIWGDSYSLGHKPVLVRKYDDGGYMAKGGLTEKEVAESNAEMVLSQTKAIKHHADELSKIVSTKSDVEAWVVGKIERASTDLSDITHYLDGQHEKMSMGGSVYKYTHKMDKK